MRKGKGNESSRQLKARKIAGVVNQKGDLMLIKRRNAARKPRL